MVNDPTVHPDAEISDLPPSGKRYWSIEWTTARHAKSFFPRIDESEQCTFEAPQTYILQQENVFYWLFIIAIFSTV